MTLSTLKAKEQQKMFASNWYGCVAGVKSTAEEGEKHTADEYLQVVDGRLQVGSTKDPVCHEFFEKLAFQLHKFGELAISFHDGFSDKHCAFQGFHWHFYVNARIHPTSDSRWGKSLIALGRDPSIRGEEPYLACQLARSHALLKHILLPPRILIYHTGVETTELVTKYLDEIEKAGDEKVDVEWGGARLKQNSNVTRIKTLTKLMEKHQTISINQLQQRMLKDYGEGREEDWTNYCTMMATPSFDQLVKKAIIQMKAMYMSKNIVKLFDNPPDCKKGDYLSIVQSMDIFKEWCTHQNINQEKFVRDIFDVLTKKRPKFNTFAIQGPPNAGKSFILRSLLPWYRWWGEVRLDCQGYSFAFQNAVDTGIIMVDEPVISPVLVEQFKMIMEGAETYVKCKNTCDALLCPPPVLLTHNEDLGRFVSANDNAAMKARMVHYKTKTAPFLEQYKSKLNPLIWPLQYKMFGLDTDDMWEPDESMPTEEELVEIEREAVMKQVEEDSRKRIREADEKLDEFCGTLEKVQKIDQLDGPFNERKEDEEYDFDRYDESSAEITRQIQELAEMAIHNVSFDVDLEHTHNIHDKLLGHDWDWYTTQSERDRQAQLFNYWQTQMHEENKKKYDIVTETQKAWGEHWSESYWTRTTDLIRTNFPIVRGLNTVMAMLEFIKAKAERQAHNKMLSIVQDEMRWEKEKKENEKKKETPNCKLLSVTPNAPTRKRSARVIRQNLATRALDFE